jgi:hypothetical protein
MVAKQMQLRDRKNQVEQLFKVRTRCWMNKCSTSSMMIKKEMQKEIETNVEKKNSA